MGATGAQIEKEKGLEAVELINKNKLIEYFVIIFNIFILIILIIFFYFFIFFIFSNYLLLPLSDKRVSNPRFLGNHHFPEQFSSWQGIH